MYIDGEGLKMLLTAWGVLLLLVVLACAVFSWIISKLFDNIGELLFGSRPVEKDKEEIANLISSLGLEPSGSTPSSQEWAGRRGRHAIGLSFSENRSFTVTLEDLTVPPWLKLTTLEFEASAIKTGDREFDRLVAMEGDEAACLAIFDNQTRAYVWELLAMGHEIEVEARWIKLHWIEPGLGASQLVKGAGPALARAASLAKYLRIEGKEVPNRLALNAEKDVLPEVRRKNLEALAYHFHSHALGRRKLLAALEGSDPDLQLVAAKFLFSLASTAKETVSQAAAVLVATAGSAEVPDDVVISAIKTFAARKDLDETSRSQRDSVFESVLAKKRGAIVPAVVETVAALDLRPWIPRLQEMVRSADGPMSLALARACGTFGGPEAQEILLELLKNQERSIVVEAVKALGAVGDVSTIDDLRQLIERVDDDSSFLKEAAFDAIKNIQGRLIGVEAGQLSLVTMSELEGALSQSPAAAGPGDLALADPPSPATPRKSHQKSRRT